MTTQSNDKKKKVTSKQIVAMGGVVILVLLYLVTLLAAIFDPTSSGDLFRVCLIASFCIPFLIWIYVWMYGKLTQKKTFADINLNMGINQPDTTDKEN
ncbi:MAG: hypothetical protein IJ335_04940 [Lachnospiraceae bacterium]|nr:hypothetical protein [Lachnospiraceae bacterium]